MNNERIWDLFRWLLVQRVEENLKEIGRRNLLPQTDNIYKFELKFQDIFPRKMRGDENISQQFIKIA